MSVPVLAVDIGNTSCTAAVISAGAVSDIKRYLRRDGVDHNVEKALQEFKQAEVGQIVLGSVVPALSETWKTGLSQGLGCPVWELIPGKPLEIPVTYPRPEKIGADRLANAVAAVRKVGAPVVVADFGTALTFDVVTEDRGYIGGIISPGVEMMYTYFGEKTALLPKLTPRPATHVIGTSTEEAMHAGAYYGYRGMVREIFTEIRRELALPQMKLLATGGFASTVLRNFDESVMLCPHLTLEGLVYAWEHSQAP